MVTPKETRSTITMVVNQGSPVPFPSGCSETTPRSSNGTYSVGAKDARSPATVLSNKELASLTNSTPLCNTDAAILLQYGYSNTSATQM